VSGRAGIAYRSQLIKRSDKCCPRAVAQAAAFFVTLV
jgi:hypothetical protein